MSTIVISDDNGKPIYFIPESKINYLNIDYNEFLIIINVGDNNSLVSKYSLTDAFNKAIESLEKQFWSI